MAGGCKRNSGLKLSPLTCVCVCVWQLQVIGLSTIDAEKALTYMFYCNWHWVGWLTAMLYVLGIVLYKGGRGIGLRSTTGRPGGCKNKTKQNNKRQDRSKPVCWYKDFDLMRALRYNNNHTEQDQKKKKKQRQHTIAQSSFSFVSQ